MFQLSLEEETVVLATEKTCRLVDPEHVTSLGKQNASATRLEYVRSCSAKRGMQERIYLSGGPSYTDTIFADGTADHQRFYLFFLEKDLGTLLWSTYRANAPVLCPEQY